MRNGLKLMVAALGAGLVAAPLMASELRMANGADMRSAIPAGATDPGTHIPHIHVYEGLLTWRADGSVAPMLAAEMPEVSGDGLTYTFTLRSGVNFHDGAALDAEAVAKTWNYYLDEANGWACRSYFDGSGAVGLASVAAEGADKVVFTLDAPAPALLTQMARTDCMDAAIMSPALVDAVLAGEQPRIPVGTGPYMVTAANAGQNVILEKFPDYAAREEPADGYAGKKEALIDRITVVIIPDPAAVSAALLAGDVDMWPRMDLNYVGSIENAPGLVVASADTPSLYTLAMQTAEGGLVDPKIRQAISYAIDREAMSTALTAGRTVPSSTLIPASMPAYDKVKDSQFTYDPEKAQALLAEAGYDGEAITLTTNKNYAIMYETGVMVQGYMSAVGINAALEVQDFSSQFAKYYSGKYDLLTWNYNPSLMPALTIDRITGSKEAQTSKLWTRPEAREVTDKLIAAPTGEQEALYMQLHDWFMEDAPMIVWATGEVTSGYTDRIKGYEVWEGRLPRLWNITIEE
jgi:peptide/nickel transport system substrate-binding protein